MVIQSRRLMQVLFINSRGDFFSLNQLYQEPIQLKPPPLAPWAPLLSVPLFSWTEMSHIYSLLLPSGETKIPQNTLLSQAMILFYKLCFCS